MKFIKGLFLSTAQDYLGRHKGLYFVLALGGIIILSRLWYLQVITRKELSQLSEMNSIKRISLTAPRGIIFDRNMKVLVKNKLVYSLTISPQYIKDLEKTAKKIGPIINIPYGKIVKKIESSRYQNGSFRRVTIKRNLSIPQIFKLKLLRTEYSGVYIEDTIIRHYLLGKNGAQLLGYMGQISKKQIKKYNKTFFNKAHFKSGDIVGKSGLELIWNKELLGTNGVQLIEVDAKGRKIYENKEEFITKSRIEPIIGNNLVLTIDSDIQKASYKAMERNDKYGQRIGAVVAMKTNGEILSWVSSPSFNTNEFTTGISNDMWESLVNDPFSPLRNKVVQDPAPPGSIFKPFLALAALQEKIITPQKKIHSPGILKYGNRIYHDAHIEGHGRINITEAIERSSNVFFYKIGISLGINRIAKYTQLFGLGKKTGININSEKAGLIPTKEWKLKRFNKKWLPGETLSASIGQSFVLVTPLQIAKAYNSIALNGKVYTPFLVKKIINPNKKNNIQFKPTLEKDISEPNEGAFVDKEHFSTVREGLKNVFHGKKGTARRLKIPNLEMAGKTGTAQMVNLSPEELYIPCIKKSIDKRHHGWFVGYAPAHNPKITIAVFAERGCSGPGSAGPVFRDIAKTYIQKYHPKLLAKKKKVRKERIFKVSP